MGRAVGRSFGKGGGIAFPTISSENLLLNLIAFPKILSQNIAQYN